MIHHISIAAENPLSVADVLAEIWNGKVFAFPPVTGGYVMIPFDAQGTAIEIYPQGATLIPAVSQKPEKDQVGKLKTSTWSHVYSLSI